ncbi:hypothetical protein [Bradyrhizobium viridifuturi]|uniref:hypothetical protein n=1 Tax=Bradyrhizobium viridifuturi TaxID=1654716 RepID=UPI00067F1B7E|nr:hypothetical protein [Bradyrhizobium viridifuturi]
MSTIAREPLQAIQAKLAVALRSASDTSSVASALVADHIRASLYGVFTSRGAQAVPTTRLLSNARRALNLMWPDISRASEAAPGSKEFCSDILDRIAALGDAWQAGKGQWLTTPMRVVIPEASDRCLIVGSSPLALAQRRLGATISCGGPARFADIKHIGDLSMGQAVDTWLGTAPPLTTWTAHTIDAANSRMQDVGGLAADQLEIYGPDILRNLRRPHRWIPAREIAVAVSGTRLCRPTLQYAAHYDRPYYLAQFGFSEGSLTLQCQAPIKYDISLRLRFGLDIILETPRKLVMAQGQGFFTIDKPLRLPEPEARAFALGWPELGSPTERLAFHNDALPIVMHALKRLSINPDFVRRTVI